ncbi:hypothetical protein BVC80_9075g66 [Macleaya cordata]|uniref:Retrotransposon Copia-like N-terminal domain-containing protein n=1 Tax=Macleaya cordata TaxID=56857 RepID=A0A200PUD3_MACCD|nr:hypothetical protein BVC80_9075g66 [Macleaya cordata]
MASQTSTSTATPSALESSTYHVPNISNFNPLITIKIDHYNYLLWQDKMLSVLQSQELYDYVDHVVVPPPIELTDTTGGDSRPNPLYTQWRKADHTLVTWLKSSLIDPIYATNTISTIKKENLSITDYLHKIKLTVVSLASNQRPVPDLDLVSNVLRGFGQDYESFAVFLNHEACIDLLHQQQHSVPQSTAFVSCTQPS